MGEMIKRTLAARRRWNEDPAMEDRIYDVDLSDLKKDAVRTVEKIWEQFGMTLSDKSKANMKSWMATDQVHAGKHPVKLEDFGLTKEGVSGVPAFKEYCQDFMIPEC